MLTLVDPATRPDVVRELGSIHEQSTAFWRSLSTEVFFAPLGEAWSPADNVRHLDKSIRAVVQGLVMPKLLLFGLFGISIRSPLTFAQLRERYLAALAGGAKAPSRFVPQSDPKKTGSAARQTLMERREATQASLLKAIAPWSERALDRLVLPHPVLGRLSVREMLFFTVYHNAHHVESVARRLAA